MSLLFQIPRYCLLWLLIAQALVIAPHFERLPIWLMVAWVFCVFWRVLVYQGRWSYPSGVVKLMLVIISAIGIIMTYGSFLGLEPTVVMLITAYIFKLLEMRSRRDIIVVIYLSYFVIVTQLLFTQTMPHAIYLFLSAALVTTSLIVLHQSADRQQFWPPFFLSMKMTAQAIPLMIIMFLVFPRLEPFWSVPLPSHQNKMGVGNRMSPGDITQLARSGALAFRAEFEGDIPQQSELYWRGLVLTEFNGRTWRPDDAPKQSILSENYKLTTRSKVLKYTLILEATQQNWLFALPIAESDSKHVLYDQDFILATDQAIKRRSQFRFVSYSNTKLEPYLDPLRYQQELSLPKGFNPRAINMANQWRQSVTNDESYVAIVLNYFTNKPFVYTLQPSALGEHSVDEFLFRTRRGFCEHYASSFVFLMRAGGIPARVVMGYQGGTRSPYDNYVIVRQLDAHAWAEVWLPSKGWIRVDPTSAVSPDRIELGSEEALAEEPAFLADSPFSIIKLKDIEWLRRMQLRYDQLNHRWHSFVLGYDAKLQFETLREILGDVTPQRLALTIIGSGGLVVTFIALGLLLHRSGPKPDPVVKQYKRFCQRASRLGIRRKKGEGAMDFAQRLKLVKPELGNEIDEITRLFVELEYSEATAGARDVKRLKQLIREFAINPKLYQRT